MKRFVMLLSILLGIKAYSQPKDSTFIIKGHISTLQKGTLYFNYLYKGSFRLDSCKIANGDFNFSGKISQPVICYLNLVKTLVLDSRSIYVFLEPTQIDIELINEPFSVVKVVGSKTHDELMQWKNADKLLTAKFAGALNKLPTDFDKTEHKILEDSLLIYRDQKFNLEYNFIKDHPQSYVTPVILDAHYRSYTLAQLKDVYQNMGDELQKSIFGIRLLKHILDMIANSKGTIAADIVGNDYMTNSAFNLGSLKGQYVLIDFWGSWCQPCIKLLPDLVTDHEKFKDKNIVFVSVAYDQDANLKNCKDIVNKLDMKWVNLWSSQDKVAPSRITSMYNVEAFPTTILIGPDGKILERGEGEYGYLKCKADLLKIFSSKLSMVDDN